jgi:hypothetical protein
MSSPQIRPRVRRDVQPCSQNLAKIRQNHRAISGLRGAGGRLKHDPEKHALDLIGGAKRFSLATNAKRLRADHAQSRIQSAMTIQPNLIAL